MTDDSTKTMNDYGAMSCSLLTIDLYLKQRKMDPDTVEVTVNDKPVPRELWVQYNLRDEDEVRVKRTV